MSQKKKINKSSVNNNINRTPATRSGSQNMDPKMASSAKSAGKSLKRKSKRGLMNNPLALTLLGVVLLAVVVGGLLLLNREPAYANSMPDSISVQEAYEKYQAGGFVLDVRTQEEWDEFHAPNTTHIPLDELESRVNELPKDEEIVVICRSGNRSQEGRDILLKNGFTAVTSVNGGLKEWSAAGYPIEGTRPE